MTEIPILCNLSPEELGKRRAGLIADLRRFLVETRPLAEGYEFQLESTQRSLDLALELIRAERLCCPFLRFELRCEPGDGPIWLVLSGPEGTRAFLDSELQPTL